MVASYGVGLGCSFFFLLMIIGLKIALFGFTASESVPEPLVIETFNMSAPPPPPPSAEETGGDAYTLYSAQLSLRLRFSGAPDWLWWVIVAFVFQWAFNKCVWFVPASRTRNGEIHNRWLRSTRFWYAVYEYVLVLPNLCVGMIFIIFRAAFSLVFWLYYTFSIDVCLMPSASGVEHLDAGHAAYVAAARSDHRYNNPVVVVFISCIQDQLRRSRLEAARIKLRTALRRSMTARRIACGARGSGDDNEAKWLEAGGGYVVDAGEERGKSAAPEAAPDVSPSAEALATLQRRKRVQLRWQLLRMLHCNPSMINCRRSRASTFGLCEVDDAKIFRELGDALTKAAAPIAKTGGSAISATTKALGDAESAAIARFRHRDKDTD